MSTQKLEDVVLLRSLAIVLVVFYHSFELYLYGLDTSLKPAYTFILRVLLGGRMPLYVFISGYLFSYLFNSRNKYQEFAPFLKNKLHRLIVPYFVFSLLYFVIFRDLTFKQLLYGHAYHFWFLVMLFYCFMATHLLHKVTNLYAQLGILALAVALRTAPLPDLPLGLIYFKRFFLWFYFGYVVYYVLNKRDKFSELKKLRWLFLTFAGWAGSCVLFQYVFRLLNSTFEVKYYYAFVWVYFAIFLFFIGFCYTLVNYLVHNEIIKPQRWSNELNKYSYGIYIFHPLFIFLITKPVNPYHEACMQFAVAHPVVFPLALFGYSFVLSFFTAKFVLKTKVGKQLIG
ncbi:MAG: acyltransferase [Dysgonamonadaceae bacterium]|jgi:peptidoglycan/LPS O-acetylase OafA/YrhL|nr:acyltransferase [Dysgonamonadaceae bacterium]